MIFTLIGVVAQLSYFHLERLTSCATVTQYYSNEIGAMEKSMRTRLPSWTLLPGYFLLVCLLVLFLACANLTLCVCVPCHLKGIIRPEAERGIESVSEIIKAFTKDWKWGWTK